MLDDRFYTIGLKEESLDSIEQDSC